MLISFLFLSFAATLQGSESDVRFVYCAACICHLLQDWSSVNITAATDFITNSIVNKNTKKFTFSTNHSNFFVAEL